MELKVFDQDLMTKDDRVLSVLFDVGTLQVGTQLQSFSLSTQVKLRKVGVPSSGDGAFRGSPAPGRGPGIQVTFHQGAVLSTSFALGQKHSFL